MENPFLKMKPGGIAYLKNGMKVQIIEICGRLFHIQIMSLNKKTTWVTEDKLTYESKDVTVRQQ